MNDIEISKTYDLRIKFSFTYNPSYIENIKAITWENKESVR